MMETPKAYAGDQLRRLPPVIEFMPATSLDTAVFAGTHEGVYFAFKDYAGSWRRFFIAAIDIFVMAIGIFFVTAACIAFSMPGFGPQPGLLLIAWLAFLWLYLVLLKAFGATIGALVMRVRIVDLRGRRPSLWRMTARALLLVLPPMNPIFDWFWLSGHQHCQTLRDRVAGTYVVRRQARPAGKGPRRVGLLMFWLLYLAVAEVRSSRCDNRERMVPLSSND